MNTASPAPLPATAASSIASAPDELASLLRRHLRVGWWSVLVFLTLGLALEALHGFKVQAYLSVANETRRLMWTLAHAHGTLLGLGHLGFAFTLSIVPGWRGTSRSIASYSFIAASFLMPAGFLVGGIWVYEGDPGAGIVLVPVGGVFLFVAVLLAACHVRSGAAAVPVSARQRK